MNMVARQQPISLFRTAAGRVAVLVLVLFSVSASLSSAKQMYSYLNDQGNIVATDDLGQVPVQYRKKVKVTEMTESTPSGEHQDHAGEVPKFTGILETVMEWSPDFTISGMSKKQSQWLIGGFLVGTFAAGTLLFSRDPSIKFAMKWVLFLSVVGVAYQLYFTEFGPEGAVDRFKTKRQDIEQLHQDRTKQIDQLEQ